MAELSLAETLERTSEDICRTSEDALASLLRTAAIRLRNSSVVILDADVDYAIGEIAMENRISKTDLLRKIITEWVETNYDEVLTPTVQ